MARRALTLLGILAIVGVAGLSLLIPSAVNADEHSATRSLLSTSVAAGAELEIQITVENLGTFGQVIETLPAGFRYVRSDLDANNVEAEGQTVKFTIFGEDSFHYTVATPQTSGTYEFTGAVLDEDKNSLAVTGDSAVEVSGAALPVATRTFSAENVIPGRHLVVSLAVADYGTSGRVIETIPQGFSYVTSSLTGNAVDVSADTITFILLGEENVTYTLTAPDDPGTHDFSGTITNFDKITELVGGASQVTVDPRPAATATRSLAEPRAELGAEVDVTVTLEDYGVGAKLVETLPEGFTFVASDLAPGGTIGRRTERNLLPPRRRLRKLRRHRPRSRRLRRRIQLHRRPQRHRQERRGRDG